MWGKNGGKEEKMRKIKKKWGKGKKNEESKENMRKKWGNTGKNEEISVKMKKIGRKKLGKLGKFLFLKLRSGDFFYFCAFFATLCYCDYLNKKQVRIFSKWCVYRQILSQLVGYNMFENLKNDARFMV